MRLVTAHRILIGSAALFFVFFAGQRFIAYQNGGDTGVLATSAVALCAAIGLVLYYRNIRGNR